MKFRKPNNTLEGGVVPSVTPKKAPKKVVVEVENIVVCDDCAKRLDGDILKRDFRVCGYCGHHFRMGARERILKTVDTNSFTELFGTLKSKNVLGFEGYDDKLVAAKKCGECEAVITGTGKIEGSDLAIFAMEPGFMMGSMGSVVGEKITALFEHATKNRLPVVGFCLSGGARMQEGILSLMQMAKTSGAVQRHNEAGLLFISVLTNPTTGGVTASFASLGDIIIAEPSALIGFAGPRVIEQTIRKKLPAGFQSAEFLLEKGFVDVIVERSKMKSILDKLLSVHASHEPLGGRASKKGGSR